MPRSSKKITPRWVNRAALVVRPAKPFLDWAASLDEEAPEQAKDLAKQISVYLVGEDPNEREETAPLENYWRHIFEEQLAGWSQDENDWPETLSLAMFKEWFEVTGESVVVDLVSGPIRHEA